MNKRKLYRICLHVSIAILLLAFQFRVMHWPGGRELLLSAQLLSLVYIVIGLIEIFKDDLKGSFEKGAWLIGFLLFSPITGLYFYHSEYKRKGNFHKRND